MFLVQLLIGVSQFNTVNVTSDLLWLSGAFLKRFAYVRVLETSKTKLFSKIPPFETASDNKMLDYKVVDLRSDTITKPPKEMLLAMCEYRPFGLQLQLRRFSEQVE